MLRRTVFALLFVLLSITAFAADPVVSWNSVADDLGSDGFADPDVSKRITISPPYITALSPNGGEVYESDVEYTVEWQSLGVGVVDIFYTQDDGKTWNVVAEGIEASHRFFMWDVPPVMGDTFIIKVSDNSNPDVYDVSDDYFRIRESYIIMTYPAGAEEWEARTQVTLTWTATTDLQNLKIEISVDNGVTWIALADNIPSGDGEYILTVPLVESDSCFVRLYVHNHSGMHAINGTPLTITAPEPGPGWTVFDFTEWNMPEQGSNCIEADPLGGVWMGSNYEGYVFFNGKTWEKYILPDIGSTYDILFDKNGLGWFGSHADNPLSYDRQTWNAHPGGPKWTLKMAVTKDNILWVGSTDYGLYRYDGGNWIAYTAQNSGLKSNHIATLSVDNENRLWIGYGYFAPGVTCFDGKTWHHMTSADGLIFDNILASTITEEGVKWFGAFEGVCSFDGSKWKYYTSFYPADEHVVDMAVDRNGYVWVSMQHGLACYNGKSWKAWNENNSIHETHLTDELTIDTENNKWFVGFQCALRFQDEFPPYVDLINLEGYDYTNSGETMTIKWLSGLVETLNIEVSYDDGISWEIVADAIPAAAGKYDWVVPETASDQCRIRLSAVSNPEVSDSSDAAFRISKSLISVLSPKGGELWESGSQQYIIWQGIGIDRYLVEYSNDDGATWLYCGESTVPSLNWTVTDGIYDNVRIRVSDADNPIIFSLSDSTFSTGETFITVTTPSIQASYIVRDPMRITWNASSDIATIDIEISTDQGLSWKALITNIEASRKDFAVRLPIIDSDNCLVRVIASEKRDVFDIMEEQFAIIKPEIWNGWDLYIADDGIGDNQLKCVAVDEQGRILVGTEDAGASLFDGDSWTNYNPGSSGITSEGIYAVAFAPDGTMWFAPYSSGGLCSFNGEEWKTYPDGPSGSQAITFDSAGNLWAGGYDNLIYRYDDSSWTNWSISGYGRIGTISADEKHGVFAGFLGSRDTSGGLFHFEDGEWVEMTGLYDVSKRAVGDIVFDSAGTMWIGQPVTYQYVASDVAFTVRPGIVKYDSSGFVCLSNAPEWVNGVIAVDQNDILWTGNRPAMLSYDNVKWREYTQENSAFPDYTIKDIAIDKDNRKLFALDGGGLAIYDDRAEPRLRLVTETDGEEWKGGETRTIEWASNTVIRIKVSIRFKRNPYVNEWLEEIICDNCEAENGSLEFVVPNIDAYSCVLKIESLDHSFVFDESGGGFTINITTGVADETPIEFALHQNFPNPFNPSTAIMFSLARETIVTLTVYTITGEKAATLIEGKFSAGKHSLIWNASDYASGVYFVRMEAGDFIETKKMVMVK